MDTQKSTETQYYKEGWEAYEKALFEYNTALFNNITPPFNSIKKTTITICPYHKGSEEANQWVQGWEEHKDTIAQIVADADQEMSTYTDSQEAN